jgi:hypothetical protein
VEHLPAETPEREKSDDADSSDYVAIATLGTQIEADQICSFLRANRIIPVVEGEYFRNAYGIRIGGVESLHIKVPRELAGAASDLLAKADRGELTIEEDHEP